MEIVVYSWAEIVAVSGTPARARDRLRDHVYRRVYRDSYVWGDTADTPEVRVAALKRVLPEHAVLSHWTALWVLGLDVLQRDRQGVDLLDMTVPREHHLADRPGLRWCSGLLTDDDLVEVGGVLVASAAKAIVDVARRDGVVEGTAAGDAALRAGAATADRIEAAVERSGGLRHVNRARAVLPLLDGRSESLMESRLRVDLILSGGPRMRCQVDLYDDDHAHCGRCDMFLDGVCFEYDGRASRLEESRFTGDRRRGNDIAGLEVEVRRFMGALYDKTTSAQRLAILLEALAIAARRTRPRLRFGPDTLRAPKLRPLSTVAELSQARRSA